MSFLLSSTEVTTKTFQVELTEDDAKVIFDITRLVGGNPRSSRRKLVDAIGETMSIALVDYRGKSTDISGSIDFESTED